MYETFIKVELLEQFDREDKRLIESGTKDFQKIPVFIVSVQSFI
ncbi:DUF4482 domain-containing protein [Planococcus halotolerans]|nr:DUF4482 domain-containing protein [Planococcus halotolerans]